MAWYIEWSVDMNASICLVARTWRVFLCFAVGDSGQNMLVRCFMRRVEKLQRPPCSYLEVSIPETAKFIEE
jgi:hypothetical protein